MFKKCLHLWVPHEDGFICDKCGLAPGEAKGTFTAITFVVLMGIFWLILLY